METPYGATAKGVNLPIRYLQVWAIEKGTESCFSFFNDKQFQISRIFKRNTGIFTYKSIWGCVTQCNVGPKCKFNKK